MADTKTSTTKADEDKAATTKKEADAAVEQASKDAEVVKAQADLIEELKKKLAESESKNLSQEKLQSAALSVAEATTVGDKKGLTIQCILRRKGGTTVAFGHNAAKQTVYKFKPINPEDNNSPHVCNVANSEHAQRFLGIPESYRLYDEDNANIDKIEVTSGNNLTEDAFLNKFDDILSINFDTAENETIKAWAKEVLGLTPSHTAKIREKAASLDVKEAKGDNMNELLRKIGVAMQEEELAASEQAKKDK